MPSTYKQSFLKLNKFVGSDKPKMDDYNNDTRLIDENAALVDSRLRLTEEHMKNSTCHVSPEEKSSWNNLKWVIGSYVGNGATQREISVGFKARLGFVFQKNEFISTAFSDECPIQNEQRFVILTELGSSRSSMITPNGFKIANTSNISMDSRMPRMNIPEKEYIYVLFR